MLCAAALALTLGLAGCGPVDGDPIRPAPGSAGQSSSTAASDAEDTEPEQLAALRQLAGEDGELAGIDLFASVVQDDHMVLPTVSLVESFQYRRAH